MIGQLLLGHVLGDYFFQSDLMAENKHKTGLRATAWCALHSAVYSLWICIAMLKINPVTFGVVFLTHFPIDRISAAKYVMLAKGSYIEKPTPITWFVYIIIDNSMHLMLMGAYFYVYN